MNILVISDIESVSLWDYFEYDKIKDIDLILSCGDLDAQYLSFLVTFANCPLLYVHGNHDGRYERKKPEGCICIEDQIYTYKGIRVLGLGGSYRYSGGMHQYTQSEMKWRVKKLWFQLRRKKGFDILLTHAAAFGIDDAEDLPHTGFHAFTELIEKYMPKYFIHGHIHLNYGIEHVRKMKYKETMIINGYESYRFVY